MDSEHVVTDPALLGYVRGIVEMPDKSVLVLDSENKTVVRFSANGRVRQFVIGGYGSEPGEFVGPHQLAIDARGNVYVLDSETRRVSVFDSLGHFTHAISIHEADPFDFVVRDTLLWILRNFKGNVSDAVSVYTCTGQPVGTALPVTDREKEFALGYTGALALTPDGSILFGHTEPGTWSAIDRAGRVWRRGREALPTSHTTLERLSGRLSRVHAPGGTLAIGAIGPNRIGILWATEFVEKLKTATVENDRHLTMNYYLDVFRPDGTYLGTSHILDGDFVEAAAFVPRSHALYVAVRDPFPEVREYVVQESRIATE